MTSSQIPSNQVNTTALNYKDLHNAILQFNNIASDDPDKPGLKQMIEKQITSLNVSWDLIPIS